MDGAEDVGRTRPVGSRPGPVRDHVLPTRAAATAALHDALDCGAGPALLTGGPGVGKSWLARRLCRAMPADWSWARLDLSPAVAPPDLDRLVASAMGLPGADRLADVRGAIHGLLAEAAADGFRWGLVVDEAHLGATDVLDELRVLANRLGEPGAWSGMLLVGQTPLLARLGTRPLSGLDARIARRIHLRPLGIDEWSDWLARLDARMSADAELWHRDARGNPRRLLGYLADAPGRPLPVEHVGPGLPASRPDPASPSEAAEPRAVGWEVTPVAPVKPPLEIGEGMIEVGWDDSPEVGADLETGPEPSVGSLEGERPAGKPVGAPSEERVDDHYAALQAWAEWTENQGRRPVASSTADSEGDGFEDDADGLKATPSRSAVRAEGQHAFAPYSQLFSRLKPSRDPQ